MRGSRSLLADFDGLLGRDGRYSPVLDNLLNGRAYNHL